MAKLCLFVLGCGPFLRVVLCLLTLSEGDDITSPENVTFQTGFFEHVLIWDHDKSNIDGVLYEIQYTSYGSNWTSVPHCHLISNQSCDLTVETLPKSLGYIGRVRSVLGNKTSSWSRSTRHTFKEVILPPPSAVFEVDGSSINVELTLAKITKGNVTCDFKDYFPFNRIYNVLIRRTKDNHTFLQVKDTESFSITGLTGSNEYCLSVQPSIESRTNIGEASPESCIYLPEQGLSNVTLLILAVCFLSFLVLLICVNLFICLYVRGVVTTPKTLKSLIQRSWSWMDKPASPVIETTLCWEIGFKDHLMAEPRDSPMRSSADSGFGSQLFVNTILKPCPMSFESSPEEKDVTEPKANSELFSVQEEIPNRSVQGEDSGISLSTGSPTLKRTSSHNDTPYRGNTQSCDDCGEEIVVNVRQGYLKQLEPEKNQNSNEDQEMENPWQIQTKDYLSQRPETLCKDQMDLFQEPWIQVPETFQTNIPLTVAFSPFSRVLWDIEASAPSLGDVEILDTRS
ncbi:interleukin-10 receptor subunit alpha [Leptodactylus fuscus]|uniref:interleukin-10 receptor subunit alpha n=1 Tax=Leptodactylus fuscus TaxID=238119 RepID=UPI003F4E8400